MLIPLFRLFSGRSCPNCQSACWLRKFHSIRIYTEPSRFLPCVSVLRGVANLGALNPEFWPPASPGFSLCRIRLSRRRPEGRGAARVRVGCQFLPSPTNFAVERQRCASIWATCLGAGVGARHGSTTSDDALYDFARSADQFARSGAGAGLTLSAQSSSREAARRLANRDSYSSANLR